ncbi:lysophosphatidic acid receptor 6-like [Protopterus annectens]|uniref:lysophosphatidic acid receptor 6-like n=1 Tax=Protopterus annectens TaxID=7888 RepID=UPI001CF9DFC8|nr:lysophosphatidic acid receptor 6-like [Protopterus annectens]
MTANNSTCILDTFHQYRYGLYTTTYILVFIFGLPLNVIVLWICFQKFRLWTSTVTYIANLACSDLLFTLSLPLKIYYYALKRWPFGDVVCRILATLFSFNVYSSSIIITLISLDRYLAIVYPIRSRNLRSPKAAKIACAVMWAFIIILSFPLWEFHKTSVDENNEARCFECHLSDTWKSALKVIIGMSFFGFFLPFVITVFCIAATIRVLVNWKWDSGVVDKYKVIKLYAINAIIFVICFCPFHTIITLYAMEKSGLVTSSQGNLSHALIVTMCLTSTNCLFDPLVYFFASSTFRVQADRQIEMQEKKENPQN